MFFNSVIQTALQFFQAFSGHQQANCELSVPAPYLMAVKHRHEDLSVKGETIYTALFYPERVCQLALAFHRLQQLMMIFFFACMASWQFSKIILKKQEMTKLDLERSTVKTVHDV